MSDKFIKRYEVISIDETGENTAEIVEYLRGLYIDVRVTRNEVEAYRALVASAFKIQLIIWNIYHEQEDVLEKVKMFKNRPESRDIPIIIFSQNSSKDYVLRASMSGVSGFVIRPYDKAFVVSKICNLLGIMVPLENQVAAVKDIVIFSMDEIITKELKAAGRIKYPLSMIMVSFKPEAQYQGDAKMTADMLKVFTDVVKPKLRETDWVFQYAQDVALVLLPFTDNEGIEIVKEKVKNIFAKNAIIKMQIQGFNMKVASVTYPDDGKTKNKLMGELLQKI